MFTYWFDGARAVINGLLNGEDVSMVTAWRQAAPTPASLQTLADTMMDSYETNMLPLHSNRFSVTDVTVYDMSSPTGVVLFALPAGTGIGGLGGAASANQTCVLASYKTEARGPSGRGRTYIPGWTGGAQANSEWTVAHITAVFGAWVQVINDVEDQLWELVVAQQYEDGVQLASANLRDVTAVAMDTGIYTQRRRAKPVG